jgi:hypothetical protein
MKKILQIILLVLLVGFIAETCREMWNFPMHEDTLDGR